MTAYIDTFRSVVLTPDNITLLADGVSDALTINADANKGLSLSASAEGSDTLDLNVDYSFSVPIGTSILRLQDVNANQKDITLSAGANITITRNSSSELVLSSTVGGNSKAIGGATVANPVVITTTAAHGFTEGIPVTLSDIAGMTQLNGNEYFMDILTSDTFALYTDANLSVTLDGTGFSAYSSGGVATAEYQTTNLSQMGDVLLTSPSVGKLLYHNGTKWIDQIVDSSIITENTNLFYTDTRVDNRFDTRLALKSTSDLAEGTNLYYTDARAQAAITASHINSLTGVIADSVDGDLTGSVFADDSTLLVDGVNGKIVGDIETSQLRTSEVNIKLGLMAGANGQQTSAIAIGSFAAATSVQGESAIAIGMYAGDSGQTDKAVAIGYRAGQTTQGTNSVAIGTDCGKTNQSATAVAIGSYAGFGAQGLRATALGKEAGYVRQGEDAIAIGSGAGLTDQGADAIAIGDKAGQTNQAANTIVLNATGSAVQNTTANSLVVKPIRNAVNANYLQYNSTSGEITYTNDLALDGVLTGSVFGDDSTLLVDGINNRLVMANNTTDDLAEGSNNKYFTNGRAIAMTIVFG